MGVKESVTRKAERGEGETRAMRGLQFFRERGHEIVSYLDRTYGVPSRTIENFVYHVDLETETCQCPSFYYWGGPCLHMVAAEAKRARDAARIRRSVSCDGCGERFSRRELIEVGPELAEWSVDVREGERYCRACARRVGVA